MGSARCVRPHDLSSWWAAAAGARPTLASSSFHSSHRSCRRRLAGFSRDWRPVGLPHFLDQGKAGVDTRSFSTNLGHFSLNASEILWPCSKITASNPALRPAKSSDLPHKGALFGRSTGRNPAPAFTICCRVSYNPFNYPPLSSLRGHTTFQSAALLAGPCHPR